MAEKKKKPRRRTQEGILEDAKAWIKTPEARTAIRLALQESARDKKSLDKQRVMTPEGMKKQITI